LRIATFIAVLLTYGPASVRATDVWLITDASRINAGEPLWVGLAAGERFAASSIPLESPVPIHDIFSGADSEIANLRIRDGIVTSRSHMDRPGIHVLGAELNLSNSDGPRVQYTAKTIVTVDPIDSIDRGFERPLNHTLEIIPLTNPASWQAGRKALVRVLLEGNPWPGVKIAVGREGEESGTAHGAAETDSNGIAAFILPRAGHCYIRAEVTRPANGLDRSAEILRATLSFRTRSEVDLGPMFLAIRSIHGELDAPAIIGYRMSIRAMAALGVSPGSRTLRIVHWAPRDSALAGVVDGVQAATKASAGRANLRLEDVPSAQDVETIFTDVATNRRVVCRIMAQSRRRIEESKDRPAEESAFEVAVEPDDRLFEVTSLYPAELPPDSRPQPPGLIEAAIANAAPRL